MRTVDYEEGNRVVRTKGDYVVGRTGTVIEVDNVNRRARVYWDGFTRTWVKFDVIELRGPFKTARE